MNGSLAFRPSSLNNWLHRTEFDSVTDKANGFKRKKPNIIKMTKRESDEYDKKVANL
jgi:hypothetical protein